MLRTFLGLSFIVSGFIIAFFFAGYFMLYLGVEQLIYHIQQGSSHFLWSVLNALRFIFFFVGFLPGIILVQFGLRILETKDFGW